MTAIRLDAINNFILKDVDLEIPSGELFVIIGPSGAGKTTLLNVVAGLSAHKGDVFLNGLPAKNMPVYRRRVGYVFQAPMLFPHLNVEENVSIAAAGEHRTHKREKALASLELLGISHLRKRNPAQLSAGERQRAALARALAPEPQVLLLDEPFANLDVRNASIIRTELKRLIDRLSLTTLFVTHNLKEAKELEGRIAMVVSGRITKTWARGASFDSSDLLDVFSSSL